MNRRERRANKAGAGASPDGELMAKFSTHHGTLFFHKKPPPRGSNAGAMLLSGHRLGQGVDLAMWLDELHFVTDVFRLGAASPKHRFIQGDTVLAKQQVDAFVKQRFAEQLPCGGGCKVFLVAATPYGAHYFEPDMGPEQHDYWKSDWKSEAVEEVFEHAPSISRIVTIDGHTDEFFERVDFFMTHGEDAHGFVRAFIDLERKKLSGELPPGPHVSSKCLCGRCVTQLRLVE